MLGEFVWWMFGRRELSPLSCLCRSIYALIRLSVCLLFRILLLCCWYCPLVGLGVFLHEDIFWPWHIYVRVYELYSVVTDEMLYICMMLVRFCWDVASISWIFIIFACFIVLIEIGRYSSCLLLSMSGGYGRFSTQGERFKPQGTRTTPRESDVRTSVMMGLFSGLLHPGLSVKCIKIMIVCSTLT
jgi:hypothetical protein